MKLPTEFWPNCRRSHDHAYDGGSIAGMEPEARPQASASAARAVLSQEESKLISNETDNKAQRTS